MTIWPDPQCAPEVAEAMRQHLQPHYDAYGLGPVPSPKGAVSDVGQEHVALLLETKPDVVSFHFGLPDPDVMQTLKAAGIFLISSATTVAEARILERSGVDAIIAQGIEAGGHRGTFTSVDISMQPGLFSLLPQMVDAVRVPVIAAGGLPMAALRQRPLSSARVRCRWGRCSCAARRLKCARHIVPRWLRPMTPIRW